MISPSLNLDMDIKDKKYFRQDTQKDILLLLENFDHCLFKYRCNFTLNA